MTVSVTVSVVAVVGTLFITANKAAKLPTAIPVTPRIFSSIFVMSKVDVFLRRPVFAVTKTDDFSQEVGPSPSTKTVVKVQHFCIMMSDNEFCYTFKVVMTFNNVQTQKNKEFCSRLKHFIWSTVTIMYITSWKASERMQARRNIA